MTTFFGKVEPKFLPVPKDGNVDVGHFLSASKQLIPIIDMLGCAMKTVADEVLMHITKLQNIYSVEHDRLPSFRAILLNDVANGNTFNPDSATQSLIWLNRSLHFLLILLRLIIEDNHKDHTDSLTHLCKKAYDMSLKKHLRWQTQKVSAVILKTTPSKEKFLRKLAFDHEDRKDQVIEEMKTYSELLADNVGAIMELLSAIVNKVQK